MAHQLLSVQQLTKHSTKGPFHSLLSRVSRNATVTSPMGNEHAMKVQMTFNLAMQQIAVEASRNV
jgi:hypothetical protein